MDKEQVLSEPRKFIRIPKRIEIDLNELSLPLEVSEAGEKGFSKNISFQGICFIHLNCYNPGVLLMLKLFLPGWRSYGKSFSKIFDMTSESFFSAIGEVVWCRKLMDNSIYEIGIKFVNIDEDDHRAFGQYLEKYEKTISKVEVPVYERTT